MAGDWIKMRCNLDTDWRVIQIASQLEMSELHVVGCLWKLWTWADQNTADGNAVSVTDVTLDRFTGVTGFASSMRNVGWLTGENYQITFPNFVEHNGSTAKKRAKTQQRVSKHRNARNVTDVTLKALPEKRREEKSITHTHTDENVPKQNLPEWVVDPWERSLKTVFAVTGRQMPETTQDATLMEVLRRGEAKGKADLEFSIMKGAKTLLDSGNDFQARSVGSTARSASKSKSEAIKEFCK